MRFIHTFTGLFLMMGLLSSRLEAQPVIVHPNVTAPLDQRWSWALSQRPSQKEEYWVGYSIRRLMGEHTTIGTYNTDWAGRASLKAMIEGRAEALEDGPSDDERVRRAAKKALEDMEDQEEGYIEPKVWKDVALLFRFTAGLSVPDKSVVVTMSNPFDPKGRPLFWLEGAENRPSLDLLARLYEAVSVEARKSVLGAIGVHQEPAYVVPYLQRALTGGEGVDIRQQAAFWLGQQDVPEALRILERAAAGDRSVEVRRQAVFGISQLDLKEATEALIDLARGADEREVRKQAIFWLAQRASRNVAETLRGFVDNDPDTEVKKQAVFALTQLRHNQGVPILIDIARKHANREVRKQAIFWLGQSDDPRALDTLVDIARNTDR
jgi:HEAT repeat protein